MVYGSIDDDGYNCDQDDNYANSLCEIIDKNRAEITTLKEENALLKAKLSTKILVPLTDDQIYDHLCYAGLLGAVGLNTDPLFLYIARAIEKAHNIV